MNNTTFIFVMIICTTFCSTVFSSSSLFMDTQNTPKDLSGEIGILIFIFVYLYSLKFKKELIQKNKISFYTILFISLIAGVEAIYGIFEFILNLIFDGYISPSSASFNNPAGFSALLSFVYPYTIYLHRILKKNIVYIKSIIILIIIGVLTSCSRTGILCIVYTSIYYFYHRESNKIRNKTAIYIYALIFLFAGLLWGLYIINKDSANGRIFIWERAVEMIKEKPFLGYGMNGFEKNYMMFQADYFENHPDSSYSILADNVQFSYNEFISFIIDWGLLGFIVLTFIALFIFYHYKQESHTLKVYACMSFISTLIFSLFSYPFSYFFTWIMLVMNIYLMTSSLYSNLKFILISSKIKFFLTFIALLITGFLFLNRVFYLCNDIKWKNAYNLYIYDNVEVSLDKYKELYFIKKNEPRFLYNYASVLYNLGKYDDSFRIANESNNLWRNYNTEILLGDIENNRNNNEYAINHYMTAHNMCPNRFVPLYKQFKIYKAQGDTAMMISIGNEILAKRVKVPSRKIDIILNNVRYELQKISSNG